MSLEINLIHTEALYEAAEILFFKMWLFPVHFISEVQPIITKSSVSPIFKTHFGNQTYKQNATKFIKILVCTTICLTMTSCSQHQWIWSSFFIGVDNKVNISIFYIFLKEENNKLFTRYLHYSLLKVIKSFPLEIFVSCTNFLPKQKGLKAESLQPQLLHISQICGCKMYQHFCSKSQALILQNIDQLCKQRSIYLGSIMLWKLKKLWRDISRVHHFWSLIKKFT